MRQSNQQGCFRRQAGYKGKKKWLWEGIPAAFLCWKGIVGDSAKDGFFVMYTLFERKRGISYEFLNFADGKRFCGGICFTGGEFYCMLEIGKMRL